MGEEFKTAESAREFVGLPDMNALAPAHEPRQRNAFDPAERLTLKEIRELDEKYVLQTYARMPVAFQYGAGDHLYDTEGKEYIDFLSGIAVTALGHAHSDLIAALNQQAEMLWHTSNLFFNQQQAQLARALVEINFPGKVFFCNSGTEANEAALKFMRAYGQTKSPARQKVVAVKDGFHGRTFGALSITGQDKIQKGFGEILGHIEFVAADDIAGLSAAIDSNTCGVIFEPVQGESGVIPLSSDFLKIARARCNEEGALLCFDEIQIGMGRSGHYFAYQHYGVLPDIVTMAKGLGGGFPIGAMLVAEKHAAVFEKGMHGTTFGGNHLATAVAYEVIRTIEAEKILDHVKASARYLTSALNKLKEKYPDKITEVRGLGLLIGIVFVDSIEARPLIEKALQLGLIVGRGGNSVLRLAPPLNVRKTTMDAAVEKLDQLVAGIQL
ncbi:aspartate aminotransferase family protein [Turneriella parva]|uniref:Acetylornithine aminotransferase n=1 Tax=Turneriella parva (strain ATCC BAA-1111 / DSM 21527 / NCTC 11395 / H) TaxID=869212 RepID=I4BB61_TURPD|nr:aspartate aminotransferase family protein [Turneriella parva]AFM14518.1 acetylornithine aminotransferase apoenzyme [Turneriella parva DSM 21527]